MERNYEQEYNSSIIEETILTEDYIIRTFAEGIIKKLNIEELIKFFNIEKIDPLSKENIDNFNDFSCKKRDELLRLQAEKLIKIKAKINIY